MDSSATEITFDAEGVCNYCTEFLARSGDILAKSLQARVRDRDAFVARVKEDGLGKPYDCIVGMSGGVDSSFALVRAVELGLRPLAVHMDNGWNAELAQHNIANLIKELGIDLYTHVIDWEEYRDLMQAFFDADVVDVELLYDNAMFGVNYGQAAAHGVRWILAGSNESTEGMHMPPGWNWLKFDARNIRGIAQRSLTTFPAIGTLGYLWNRFKRRIQWVPFLDHFEYDKATALAELTSKYGYKPYPFKHYESVFTRFYQGYLLPEKFGIDKRRLHLSTLIVTGQMDRDEALRLINGLAYESEEALAQDRAFFLKKMRWTEANLDAYLRRPRREHSEFPTERALWDFLVRIKKKL